MPKCFEHIENNRLQCILKIATLLDPLLPFSYIVFPAGRRVRGLFSDVKEG
jgi:hypothetical protein